MLLLQLITPSTFILTALAQSNNDFAEIVSLILDDDLLPFCYSYLNFTDNGIISLTTTVVAPSYTATQTVQAESYTAYTTANAADPKLAKRRQEARANPEISPTVPAQLQEFNASEIEVGCNLAVREPLADHIDPLTIETVTVSTTQLQATRTTETLTTHLATLTAVPFDLASLDPEKGKLIDFSYAGYKASNEPLPARNRPATLTLASTNDQADRTADIQTLLNQCPNQIIELAKGDYYLADTLNITQSNCTLRGTGFGDSRLFMVGDNPARSLLLVNATHQPGVIDLASSLITASYVGVGTSDVLVANASLFAVGDSVYVERTASATFIHTLGMDTLVRAKSPQTWLAINSTFQAFRVIAAINGSTVTLDVPLTDAVDASQDDNGQLVKYTDSASELTEVAVENLYMQPVPDQSGQAINVNAGKGQAVVFGTSVKDSWTRDLELAGWNNVLRIERASKRITLSNTVISRSLQVNSSAGYATDFGCLGSQILMLNTTTKNLNGSNAFGFTTDAAIAGPNVDFNHYGIGIVDEQPHQRWSTGFLADSCVFDQSDLSNRGTSGSGQGWAIANSINYNVISTTGFLIQKPPIGQNWCVGCIGPQQVKGNITQGAIISPGVPVEPPSLFVSQLSARLGTAKAMEVVSS